MLQAVSENFYPIHHCAGGGERGSGGETGIGAEAGWPAGSGRTTFGEFFRAEAAA